MAVTRSDFLGLLEDKDIRNTSGFDVGDSVIDGVESLLNDIESDLAYALALAEGATYETMENLALIKDAIKQIKNGLNQE